MNGFIVTHHHEYTGDNGALSYKEDGVWIFCFEENIETEALFFETSDAAVAAKEEYNKEHIKDFNYIDERHGGVGIMYCIRLAKVRPAMKLAGKVFLRDFGMPGKRLKQPKNKQTSVEVMTLGDRDILIRTEYMQVSPKMYKVLSRAEL